MSDAREQIVHYVAWMEVRAQSRNCGPGDSVHAKATADWLRYWLSHSETCLEQPICAFLLNCAEQELSALASPSCLN